MPKRVLFLNHSLDVGGIETMIVDMIRLLPPAEFVAEVAVFQSGGSLEGGIGNKGIVIHHLEKKSGIDFGLVLRLRRVLVERSIHVLHTHNYSAWFYGSLAARILTGVKHVHTEHSAVEPTRARYALERILSALTDHVIAVSDHVQDALVNAVGIPASRVQLVFNGVNTERFVPNLLLRRQIRRQLGLLEEEVTFGIVARLVPVKNHTLLLSAFALAREKESQVMRLVIVGDGSEMRDLRATAAKLGLSDSVSFLGERHDIEALLNAFDAYVLASQSEGMNLTLLEAMATALPVVATSVGGNGEIVEHGHTGFLVPLDRPEIMASRMNELSASAELRAKLGSNGRASVVRRFGEQAMIAQYLSLYR